MKKCNVLFEPINRQIHYDFEPYWSLGAILRLEGRSDELPDGEHPVDMRGDAIIYLWDTTDVRSALGYHEKNFRGIPFGFVFTDITKKLNENWSVALSHEALELIGDAETNILAMGPHPDPAEDNRIVFHWYEMCDAVQAEKYTIDEIEVSNFVLPLYFTKKEESGGCNDFLGRTYNGKTLTSFGVNHGGYVGFFDPKNQRMEKYFQKDDIEAKRRMKIKEEAQGVRWALRYQRFIDPEDL